MDEDAIQYLKDLYDEYGEEEEDNEIHYHYIERLDAPRDLPDPIDLTQAHVDAITTELGLIKLCWPKIEDPLFEERTNFPDSYLENTNKEKLLLLYTENFRKQFWYKYQKRKMLFLAAANECGMQKMVCTSIRPTTLGYPELETWDKCAAFVGNHLRFEPYHYPTLIPDRLYSPHTTFLRRSGESHEIATALCSLLIGLGYEAYVVFGYATRDTTFRIMIRTESPYPFQDENVKVEVKVEDNQKYAVKPMRDLRSKFLLMMEQRELDKIKEEKRKEAELEKERRDEEEKPPLDDLEGQRYHFWILLKTEGRQVDEMINMQDENLPLNELDYDLRNAEKWEHLLPGEPIGWREAKVDLNMEDDEVALAAIMVEKHLDMPPSWSKKITIPHHILKQKYPDGMQRTWFKRTLVEEYAPFVQTDGLVTKITRFNDFECTDMVRIENLYENRHDRLMKCIYDLETDLITEYFGPGREDAVLKHSFGGPKTELTTKRRIESNHKARFDGLMFIELDAENMEENYTDRDDLFYFRQVKYAKKGQPPPGMQEGNRKIIMDFVEKFYRNKNKSHSEDIAIRQFSLVERKIFLKYHFGEGKVTATTRTFIKPVVADINEELLFNPELTFGYQADFGMPPPRELELFLVLRTMLREEVSSVTRIREIEDQISDFLMLRDYENGRPKLIVSLFNQEQNEEYKQGMLEKERLEQEYKEKEIEVVEIDYLSPYLNKLKITLKKISKNNALRIKAMCLTDFKQLLLNRALDIQHQFEKWGDFLKSRQAWFHVNQDIISEEDEVKYFQEVSDLTFLLQSYEIRLARHRDLSIPRYQALLRYLKVKLKV